MRGLPKRSPRLRLDTNTVSHQHRHGESELPEVLFHEVPIPLRGNQKNKRSRTRD